MIEFPYFLGRTLVEIDGIEGAELAWSLVVTICITDGGHLLEGRREFAQEETVVLRVLVSQIEGLRSRRIRLGARQHPAGVRTALLADDREGLGLEGDVIGHHHVCIQHDGVAHHPEVLIRSVWLLIIPWLKSSQVLTFSW